VNLCLLLGRILFRFGATAQRIQDSITHLARYLGYKVDILVSYDALLLTVNDGTTYRTRIGSARGVAGLNLTGLVRVSESLRGLSRAPFAPEQIESALCAIRDAPPAYGVAAQVLAAGCAGAAFCIVNGGDPLSWAGSFMASAVIFILRRPLAARHFNVHLTVFAIALAGSFLAGLLARVTHTATPAIALVSPLLFLVPGAPMINGGIDIARNHVTIGIARAGFTLAVLVDLCLAAGFTLFMVPERISPPFALSGAGNVALVSLAGALAAAALACLNNAGWSLMALCAFGGLVGRLTRALAGASGVDPITASLIGVGCSTLLVGWAAERLRWPAVVPTIIAALPMVPGYFAIAGLHSLLSFAAAPGADPAQLSVGLQALSRALFISVALVVGVIGPLILLQRDRERV
jgi:uncharacterized membrane protein YjjP (DUF1212 family)